MVIFLFKKSLSLSLKIIKNHLFFENANMDKL